MEYMQSFLKLKRFMNVMNKQWLSKIIIIQNYKIDFNNWKFELL